MVSKHQPLALQDKPCESNGDSAAARVDVAQESPVEAQVVHGHAATAGGKPHVQPAGKPHVQPEPEVQADVQRAAQHDVEPASGAAPNQPVACQ